MKVIPIVAKQCLYNSALRHSLAFDYTMAYCRLKRSQHAMLPEGNIMSARLILLYIVFPIASYLIGSLTPGLWVGKLKGVDIRTMGSKNVGATNVVRVLGKKFGIAVFVLDLLKGFLPTFFFAWFTAPMASQNYFVHGIIYGACAIVGHSFSILLGFKGGKAVATGCGVFLALSPLATLIAASVWVVFFLIFRIVSIGSIVAAIVLPVAAVVLSLSNRELGRTWPVAVFAAAVAALILLRHRANIQRLMAGTESTFKKSKAAETQQEVEARQPAAGEIESSEDRTDETDVNEKEGDIS